MFFCCLDQSKKEKEIELVTLAGDINHVIILHVFKKKLPLEVNPSWFRDDVRQVCRAKSIGPNRIVAVFFLGGGALKIVGNHWSFKAS